MGRSDRNTRSLYLVYRFTAIHFQHLHGVHRSFMAMCRCSDVVLLQRLPHSSPWIFRTGSSGSCLDACRRPSHLGAHCGRAIPEAIPCEHPRSVSHLILEAACKFPPYALQANSSIATGSPCDPSRRILKRLPGNKPLLASLLFSFPPTNSTTTGPRYSAQLMRRTRAYHSRSVTCENSPPPLYLRLTCHIQYPTCSPESDERVLSDMRYDRSLESRAAVCNILQ